MTELAAQSAQFLEAARKRPEIARILTTFRAGSAARSSPRWTATKC